MGKNNVYTLNSKINSSKTLKFISHRATEFTEKKISKLCVSVRAQKDIINTKDYNSEIRIQKSKIKKMFSTTKTSNQLACTFSSSLELVDQAVRQAVMFLKEHNTRVKIFDFTLILREALNNAVLHGNKGNIDCQVEFNLVVSGKTMEINVTDQGQGFDWRTAYDKKNVGAQATHGRGLSLMNSYGYSISFNDAGNKMILQKEW